MPPKNSSSSSSSSPPRSSSSPQNQQQQKQRSTSRSSNNNKPKLHSAQVMSNDFKFYNHEESDGDDMNDIDDYFSHDRYRSGASSKQLRLELFPIPSTTHQNNNSNTDISNKTSEDAAPSSSSSPSSSSHQKQTSETPGEEEQQQQKLFLKICDNPLDEDEKKVLREMQNDSMYSPGTFQEDEDALKKDDGLVERWCQEITDRTRIKKLVIPCENGVDRYGLIIDRQVMFRFDALEECTGLEKEIKAFVLYRKQQVLKQEIGIKTNKNNNKSDDDKQNNNKKVISTASSITGASKKKVAKKETVKKVSVGKKK